MSKANLGFIPAAGVDGPTAPDLSTSSPTPFFTLNGSFIDVGEWTAWVQYNTRSGLRQIPVAGPDGTPPFIAKMHAAISSMVITAKLSATGAPPPIPDPNAVNGNATLINWDWWVASPGVKTPNGEGIYHILAVYYYSLPVAVTKLTGFPIPNIPFLAQQPPFTQVAPSTFVAGMFSGK